MTVRCESCCLVYDDAEADTGCPHYPIGTSAATFCKRCDLYKPCACPPATPRPEKIGTPEGIGINEGEGSARPDRRQNPMPAEPPENVIAYGDRTPGEHGRPPRTRRRFVTRGGELVEVESVVRETR